MSYRYFLSLLSLAILLLFSACSEDDLGGVDPGRDSDPSLADESFDSISSVSSGSSSSSGSSGQGESDTMSNEGLITAGEWNDLDNWDFWKQVNQDSTFFSMRDLWGFYTDGRVSIAATNNGRAAVNAEISIAKDGDIYWTTRTDNHGRAELWVDPFSDGPSDLSDYELLVNGNLHPARLVNADQGAVQISIGNSPSEERIEISFIVDATGSMSDELQFLKDDMADVISRVRASGYGSDIKTSAVFYRDTEDEYLIRQSDFSSDLSRTLDFIKAQSARGGGDYPEAVHNGLDVGINELSWSSLAITKLAFLILDAPPHKDEQVKDMIRRATKNAAAQGIKIIPVTASGIQKDTELLMRQLSILTNGTYVFITNDSGIGNDHIEATVGDYEVEFLNDLMVRLILKYSE